MSDSKDELATLPFEDLPQAAFLMHLFDDHNHLFQQTKHMIEATWFKNPTAGLIWDLMKAFFDVQGRLPTVYEIRDSNELVSVHGAARQREVRQFLIEHEVRKTQHPVDFLRRQLLQWMQAKLLQRSYQQSVGAFNKKRFPEAASVMAQMVKDFHQLNSDISDEKLLTETTEIANSFRNLSYVYFGLPGVDEHLAPDSKSGGLVKGDQTLILAPQNAGKTTTIITIGVHNALEENNVLLQTYEGRHEDVRMKIIRCAMGVATDRQLGRILGIDPTSAKVQIVKERFRAASNSLKETLDIMCLPKSDFMRDIYEKFQMEVNRRFKYWPYNKPGMTIEDVLPMIERATDKCINEHNKGFDIALFDYPGLLGTKRAGKDYAYRQVLDIVYRDFTQLAIQHNWHSVCAIQGNREAGKINAGTANHGRKTRFLVTEDIGEAYGPGQSATNVITINRSPAAKNMNKLTFYMAKSRSSETGLAVTAFENFRGCVTHSDELGWMSYTSSEENRMILSKFAIPQRRRLELNEYAALNDEDEE